MLRLGIIGGCSAEATLIYYADINRGVRARRPGHGADLLLRSFDVEDIDAHCRAGDWDGAQAKFRDAAAWLREGGAKAILIATNTMHKIADPIAAEMDIPLIHIGDVAAAALKAAGCSRPLLLGTRYLMGETFYRERLERHGLAVMLPEPADQHQVHAIIYDELMDGRVTEESRRALAAIVDRAAAAGADCVVLACTELGLALKDGDVEAPVFDTAALHVQAAIAFALSDES
ncbi:aspartate/glutamate racemase family protein (plasmid) [Brevundimonas staleyi]|uniref:Aspartate/glutamate racemase family protein n=1 Tax=Brevundimonas staleyi TaxID=74326 RepID=A0ABW0FNL5_9CAUL